MAFFEPLPPGDDEPEPRPPIYRKESPWSVENGVIPGEAAIERVIARGPETVIALGRISAYPSGFGLSLVVLHAVDRELDAFGHTRPTRDPGRLRFGLAFADGRRAENDLGVPPAPRDGIQLNLNGGSGGRARMRLEGYVAPLPPPGPLVLAAAWPDADVPEGTIELDAAVILDAAARAQVVFDLPEQPDEPGGAGGGWSSYSPFLG